jgi:hypothetical protein
MANGKRRRLFLPRAEASALFIIASRRSTLNGISTRRIFVRFAFALALPIFLSGPAMAREVGNFAVFLKSEKGQIVNSGFNPPDFTSECLDQGGGTSWSQPTRNTSVFNCTREAEGDGNEGSASETTFTYHFIEDNGRLFLDRVTTSRGATLKPYTVLPARGKSARR